MTLRPRIGKKGQGTVEYILIVAFGAIFTIQVARFFNEVFRDGLSGLEVNIQRETSTGLGFRP